MVVASGPRPDFETPHYIVLTPSDDTNHLMQNVTRPRVDGVRKVCPIVDSDGRPQVFPRRFAKCKKATFKGKVVEVVNDGSTGMEILYYFERARSQHGVVRTN